MSHPKKVSNSLLHGVQVIWQVDCSPPDRVVFKPQKCCKGPFFGKKKYVCSKFLAEKLCTSSFMTAQVPLLSAWMQKILITVLKNAKHIIFSCYIQPTAHTDILVFNTQKCCKRTFFDQKSTSAANSIVETASKRFPKTTQIQSQILQMN